MKKSPLFWGLCLTLCLFLSLPQTVCAYYLKEAKIVSYADGREEALRSGELLTVQTTGFAPNATLEYSYQIMNDDGGTSAILSFPLCGLGQTHEEGVLFSTGSAPEDRSLGIGYANFAVMDSLRGIPASPDQLTVKVLIRDTNPKSSTCNDTVECEYHSFLPSDLSEDMLHAGLLLFEEETISLTEALVQAGLADAASDTTLITPLSVGDGSVFELTGEGVLRACGRGSAYLELSVDRTNSPFHSGQKLEKCRLIVTVLRQPVFSTVEEGVGVMAEKIEPNITYSVNGEALKSSNSNSILFFETGIPCADQTCILTYDNGTLSGKRFFPFHTELPGHVHEWTLSVGPDDTVNAVCSSTIGMLPHSNKSTMNEHLSIVKPINVTYTGVEKLATLTRTSIGGIPVSPNEIVYYAGERALESAPVDTGDYRAVLTVDGIQTAFVPFTIEKADGNANVSLAGWKEGEEPNSPIPFSQTNGTENVSYRYLKVGDDISNASPEPPRTAGDYLLLATFDTVQNYKEITVRAEFSVEKGLPVLRNLNLSPKTLLIAVAVLAAGAAVFLLLRKKHG